MPYDLRPRLIGMAAETSATNLITLIGEDSHRTPSTVAFVEEVFGHFPSMMNLAEAMKPVSLSPHRLSRSDRGTGDVRAENRGIEIDWHST